MDWSRLRKELFLRQDGECIYCDKPMRKVDDRTIDHIVPGFSGENNYTLACGECNSFKSGFFSVQVLVRKLLLSYYIELYYYNYKSFVYTLNLGWKY